MQRKKLLSIICILAAAVLILVLLARHMGGETTAETGAPLKTAAGMLYLDSLESRDPAEVDTLLQEFRAQKIQEMRDEWLRQVESGEINVWSLFDNYVLLGDSRSVGFSYWGFLPEERVMAESGAKLYALRDHIPELQKLHPSSIYLCYGLNDVIIGVWPEPEDYVADYEELLGELRQALPDAAFYVNSILPAIDPAFDEWPGLVRIPEYTQAVKEMCDGIDNCYYVDNDWLFEQHRDLWAPDGIHFAAAFYRYWAANMIAESYNSQIPQDETSEDIPEFAVPPAASDNNP